ncbi:MAG: sigma-54-dependent Fis family transcriptional regulator [Bacteroidetes bacterium]|nr:sigma-54-dependent Fis family transcriptional regulator [Bacteroidota bacterium]
MSKTILLVDDELGICKSIKELLENSGYYCNFTMNPQKTINFLKSESIDLLIIDVRMPALGGIDLLKLVKKTYKDLPIIMITGYPSIESAVTAMKYGALNYFTKPLNIEELVKEIDTILSSKLSKQAEYSKNSTVLFSKNPEMQEMISSINQVAATDATVFICGESGTGKELIANYLHYHSNRCYKPFLKVNCAAIPEGLLESELFGHEKGAFTDAKNLYKGKFEMADSGTLFLDEIGDMDIRTQAKILRVIQEQEFQRVGGHTVHKTNIRFIAATNKDIESMIEEGHFRDDLYYRLAVIDFKLPRLAERKEDILDLVEKFLEDFNANYKKSIRYISAEVKNILLNHSWPGNIRELKNCIERAVIFSDGESIELENLSKQYVNSSTEYNDVLQNLDSNDSETKQIIEALHRTKWKKQKAAEMLNIHRKTLYNKMKKLGLE